MLKFTFHVVHEMKFQHSRPEKKTKIQFDGKKFKNYI